MNDDPARSPRKLSDVGGTSGGFGSFLLGLALLILGSYLFIDRVTVHTWGWHGGGMSWSLVPIFAGVMVLFIDARLKIGWLGIVGGFAWMVVGIASRASFVFRSTSLFVVFFILICFAGGLGLIVRALKPR